MIANVVTRKTFIHFLAWSSLAALLCFVLTLPIWFTIVAAPIYGHLVSSLTLKRWNPLNDFHSYGMIRKIPKQTIVSNQVTHIAHSWLRRAPSQSSLRQEFAL